MTDAFAITRRTTLAGLAAGTALTLTATGVRAAEPASHGLFRHGVASGDPDATSVVIWTRITASVPTPVEWEVAHDADFKRLAASGRAEAHGDADYTVKVLVTGLRAGGRYHYRFRAGGMISPAGRTRTLPTGRLDRLGIALASCSNYAFGFFNAYAAIARDSGVDFVLHTGDYIYEYGADGWGADTARKLGRVHQPAHEIISLADYRTRHAQYKTDAGAQAMHAAHPLLACWDDHESANNPWIGGAQNHQPDTEGDWAARREASIRAYFEWMPVREPVAGRTRAQFWRGYSFGDLATLFTLETRHTGRAEQVDYLPYADKFTSRADAEQMEREAINAPGRAMLAAELEADLDAALRRSVTQRQPWRLIGNPMPIARTRVPDVVAQGLMPDPFTTPGASDDAKILAWKGKWNLPFYPDTWDGYEWARERLYALSRKAGAGDLVFLTGDSHSFWANRLADAAGRPAGIELGTAGITSPGDFIGSGFAPDLSEKLDRAFEAHNPEVVWTDNLHQGYVRLALRRSAALAEFIAVDTITTLSDRTSPLKRFGITRRGKALRMEERPA
ncbi:alkaline phosphatase [Novosphingobium sp.]|uniref:alkaline phosphatase D family protein n=1 Tax=Novosphingobium sp. TaxID=1874826 RepID=UPI002734505F|nr:alkaline phosphatase D family protein [Novosphingobium sp.]MDP3906526.1 alkaline phosphatase D family protein [Novosphingobium sp.]